MLLSKPQGPVQSLLFFDFALHLTLNGVMPGNLLTVQQHYGHVELSHRFLKIARGDVGDQTEWLSLHKTLKERMLTRNNCEIQTAFEWCHEIVLTLTRIFELGWRAK